MALFDIGGVLEAVVDDAWQKQRWARWRERSDSTGTDFDALVQGVALPPIDVVSGIRGVRHRDNAATIHAVQDLLAD